MAASPRNRELSAALVCRPPVPPGGVQRAPHSPEWRAGALSPQGALSVSGTYGTFYGTALKCTTLRS